MDKHLFIHLQGGRKVSGTLRGYDLFLNLVIDDALEESLPAQKHPIGTVVCLLIHSYHHSSSAGRQRQQCYFHGDSRGHTIEYLFCT